MNLEISGAHIVMAENDAWRVEKRDIFLKSGQVFYQKPFLKADRIIDAQNKIVLPGLVNAHHHIYSTLSKGVPCEVPFHDFSGNLKQLWWPLDHSLAREDVILSTILALEDSIRYGVTTIFDHHISGYTENALSDMAEVFSAYGISGTLAFEISDRNGEEFFEKSLEENLRFIQSQLGRDIQGMIGLHASFTLSDSSLKRIAESTSRFPIHIHLAEGEIDSRQCMKEYGLNLAERLARFDLLRPDSLLIHGSNLTEKDVEILRNYDIFLVQALDSNLNNGLHVGNISHFLQNGLKTTVGTDGMTSNILKSLKNSFLFTRYLNQSADIGYPEISALLLNGYDLKQRYDLPLGIREGEEADLVIVDYMPATPFNDDQFLSHFIYGITESRIQYVFKKDTILLDDFQLTMNPYQDIKKRAADISASMFDRFKANRLLYKNQD